MRTQRRENRWQSSRSTECAAHGGIYLPLGSGDSGQARPASVALHARAGATVGTAPQETTYRLLPAWLATNSLQSDSRMIKFVWLVHQNIRHSSRSSPPAGNGNRSASGAPATHVALLPHIPFSSGFARLHPTLPLDPAGQCRWTERYDGKRDMHFQHAA
jgi:hypothetical protein